MVFSFYVYYCYGQSYCIFTFNYFEITLLHVTNSSIPNKFDEYIYNKYFTWGDLHFMLMQSSISGFQFFHHHFDKHVPNLYFYFFCFHLFSLESINFITLLLYIFLHQHSELCNNTSEV